MANTKNNHEDVITQIEANRTHLIRIEKKLDALLKSPVEEVKEEKFDVLQENDCVNTTEEGRKELFPLLEKGGMRCPSPQELAGDRRIVIEVDPSWHIDVMYTELPPNLSMPEFRRRLEGTIASRKAEQEASKLSKLKFGVKVMTPQGEGFYHYHDGQKEENAPHWISLSDGTTDYFSLSDITIVG